jgi:spore coat polysaccharide biosynthesis predicted glycosyltransferase SpsG
MRFVFHADASKVIGSGHVMRSSAIAEEVISRGFPAVFVGNISGLPWVTTRIKNLGFSQILENSSEFNPNKHDDILIIDSYNIPTSKEFLQQDKWRAIVSIFDEFTPDYACDLRIHPGLTKVWSKSSAVKTLSGPKYIPFRKSIRNPEYIKTREGLEVLVVGGGSDTCGFVAAVQNVLAGLTEEFRATMLTNSVTTLDLDERFSVSEIGSNLDLHASKTDLIFTTASTTSLEFLALGKAVAVGCAVDNQYLNYDELSRGKYAIPIGKFLNSAWTLDATAIQELVTSESLRATLRKHSQDLIDFKGAERIVDEIVKL